MGLLDAFGTFFTAMGAVYTPGSLQPLLNQSMIFWIVLISALYLEKVRGSARGNCKQSP